MDLDDEARRLVYTAVDSPLGATHYNASVQVFGVGEARSRGEWIIDFLPKELDTQLDQLMDTAVATMKRTHDALTTRE